MMPVSLIAEQVRSALSPLAADVAACVERSHSAVFAVLAQAENTLSLHPTLAPPPPTSIEVSFLEATRNVLLRRLATLAHSDHSLCAADIHIVETLRADATAVGRLITEMKKRQVSVVVPSSLMVTRPSPSGGSPGAAFESLARKVARGPVTSAQRQKQLPIAADTDTSAATSLQGGSVSIRSSNCAHGSAPLSAARLRQILEDAGAGDALDVLDMTDSATTTVGEMGGGGGYENENY